MADDSILKPIDLDEEVETNSEEVTTPVAPSEESVVESRTSFLTVGAQKPWDIEVTKFGKIANVHIVDEMKKPTMTDCLQMNQRISLPIQGFHEQIPYIHVPRDPQNRH